MIKVRKSEDRGHFNHGRLGTYHTFSFGEFRDSDLNGFRPLRVPNEDRVLPGEGFGTPPHRDMGIISYVLAGALKHNDNKGTGSVIRPGDIQRMTAGTGVIHREFNHSGDEPVHFLQIRILPEDKCWEPEYEEKSFPETERRERLRRIGSPDGRDGSVTIRQEAESYSAILSDDQRVDHRLFAGRHVWIQVAKGKADLNGQALPAGDGATVAGEETLRLVGRFDRVEILRFDLA